MIEPTLPPLFTGVLAADFNFKATTLHHTPAPAASEARVAAVRQLERKVGGAVHAGIFSLNRQTWFGPGIFVLFFPTRLRLRANPQPRQCLPHLADKVAAQLLLRLLGWG